MIIKLSGGLGNQLFQWAYGRARAAEGQDVKYTLGEDMGASGYRLDRYPLAVPMATDEEIAAAGTVLTHGWWESERYFSSVAEELRRLAPLRVSRTARQLARLLSHHRSVFVHVRRGDAIDSQSHAQVFASDYYERATEWIRDHQLYIFSDDPDWCDRHFGRDYNVMDCLAPEEDLWLMSQCRHAIIANSTFSWWAAWLGPDARGGTVIAPRDWYVGPKPHPEIVPGRWKLL